MTTNPIFGTPPALPYSTAGNPTTGARASGPSAERAVRESIDGTASARQSRILALLGDAGPTGMTWHEISDVTGDHHGQVSGALSSLHKMASVAVLKHVRRSRSGVYVLPEHVGERETRPFGGKSDLGGKTDLGTTPYEAIEQQMHIYANGTTVPTVPAPRLVLSPDERTLIERMGKSAKDYRDRGSMPVRPTSVQTLLDIIRRAQ